MHWLTTAFELDTILSSSNLLPLMEEDEKKALGNHVVEMFKQDMDSRRDWERRMKKAMELALQISEKKTFPWEGAANAKLPLITVAALQYQSRAYPALLNGPRPVKARAVKIGDKAEEARAMRIGAHMSYQVLEEMGDWEDEHDKALLIQAIMGCVFKKSWFDPARGINRSVCVNPRDLFINYWATGVEDAQRVTHLMYLSHNYVYEQQAMGLYEDFTSNYKAQPTLRERNGEGTDRRTGMTPPPVSEDTPYEVLEQCLYLDLDDDGYREPYVCTVRHDTRQPLRLAPLFTRKDIVWLRPKAGTKGKPRILRIDPCSMYTRYTFIPSPDGGVYCLGLGSLLGTLSEIVDSAINQMLDAGTLANAGGGFLGRNAKLKKGDVHVSPGKWVTLDCPGAQMKDAIMPAPVPQPSEALFKLIGLLIEWGQNIVGATDAMLGANPGQNTPASTQQSMLEQGMATFNGIYKRTYKAQTAEFQKLYRLNVNFVADGETKFYTMHDTSASIFGADYSSDGAKFIRPGANPRYMSSQQRLIQASNIFQTAQSQPNWDKYQASLNLLEAWNVEDPDRFVVDPARIAEAQKSGDMSSIPPGVVPAPNPVMITAQAKQGMVQIKQKELELKEKDLTAKLQQAQQQFQLEVEKTRAEIAELSARAASEMAQANGVDIGHQIALLETQIGAKNAHLDRMVKMIDATHKAINTQWEMENANAQRGHELALASMAGARGNEAPSQ